MGARRLPARADGDLVVRASPPATLERERAWVEAVRAEGFPAPEPLAGADGGSGLLVFRRPPGTNLAERMIGDMPALPRLLAEFGRLHAALHALPVPVGPPVAEPERARARGRGRRRGGAAAGLARPRAPGRRAPGRVPRRPHPRARRAGRRRLAGRARELDGRHRGRAGVRRGRHHRRLLVHRARTATRCSAACSSWPASRWRRPTCPPTGTWRPGRWTTGGCATGRRSTCTGWRPESTGGCGGGRAGRGTRPPTWPRPGARCRTSTGASVSSRPA